MDSRVDWPMSIYVLYNVYRYSNTFSISFPLISRFSSPTFALQYIYTETYKCTYDERSPKGRKWGLIDGHITCTVLVYTFIYYIYIYEFGTCILSSASIIYRALTLIIHTAPAPPLPSSPLAPRVDYLGPRAKGVTPTYGQLLKQ